MGKDMCSAGSGLRAAGIGIGIEERQRHSDLSILAWAARKGLSGAFQEPPEIEAAARREAAPIPVQIVGSPVAYVESRTRTHRMHKTSSRQFILVASDSTWYLVLKPNRQGGCGVAPQSIDQEPDMLWLKRHQGNHTACLQLSHTCIPTQD
ncbi:uncharacterized protein BKA78DRAFT_372373 [Phyllosticta capitalensis]|uniref:uncharacterized protein n=1 Tax=Phyllosticta capitalensis TaxID=121624 RepID=UPI0031316947